MTSSQTNQRRKIESGRRPLCQLQPAKEDVWLYWTPVFGYAKLDAATGRSLIARPTTNQIFPTEGPTMEAKKITLTLDVDPAFQRRLEAAAALKGVSTLRYCRTAIDRELTRDRANAAPSHRFNRQSFEKVVARRRKLFGGRPLPGDSPDLIREAREIRDAQIENRA